MIDNHADERLGCEQRVYAVERPLLAPPTNVAGQVFIEHPVAVPKEHVGKLVALQGAEQQQTQERRIGATVYAKARDQSEDAGIVALLSGSLDGVH